MYTHTHTHTHTHIHIYIHTYIHTYMYIHSLLGCIALSGEDEACQVVLQGGLRAVVSIMSATQNKYVNIIYISYYTGFTQYNFVVRLLDFV